MNVVETSAAEAEAAIRRMAEAAREARALHARAELLRHMRTTAGKLADRPRADAVEAVVREWMTAWGLFSGYRSAERPAGEGSPGAPAAEPATRIADALRPFTEAFHDLALAERAADAVATGAADARLRAALHGLDAAFRAAGTTLADEMAWRSECAHGWWALVAPPPPDVPRRESVPALDPRAPFWEAGPAPHCR